ncbi:unnamed protein product [Vicia faba]|uniref:Uncharacterized protein n=1 Tax=Vicia faba TaxID=3906 RepID=A0AAV1AI25_VICFA|nr:unnamed protein product [Vicia faba]
MFHPTQIQQHKFGRRTVRAKQRRRNDKEQRSWCNSAFRDQEPHGYLEAGHISATRPPSIFLCQPSSAHTPKLPHNLHTISHHHRPNQNPYPLYFKQPLTSQTQSSNHPLSRRHLHSAVKSLTLCPGVCIPSPFRARAQSHQMDGSDSRSKETIRLSSVEPILRFARGNVLPLALISAVTLGLTYPSLGCALDKYRVSKIWPFGIFVISGLMLRSEEIGAAVEAWPVGLFGASHILLYANYIIKWCCTYPTCWGKRCTGSCNNCQQPS